jgi:hypothetical protein
VQYIGQGSGEIVLRVRAGPTISAGCSQEFRIRVQCSNRGIQHIVLMVVNDPTSQWPVNFDAGTHRSAEFHSQPELKKCAAAVNRMYALTIASIEVGTEFPRRHF